MEEKIDIIAEHNKKIIGGFFTEDILLMSDSDIRTKLGCISKHFKPTKDYYKFSKTDSCNKVFRAFNIDFNQSHRCSNCFLHCINNDVEKL